MTDNNRIDRRTFLGTSAASAAYTVIPHQSSCEIREPRKEPFGKPNLLFVFADQWRADATGYAGDRNVHTPNLDQLERESFNFTHAVSGCPVCSPYRASLMTGQYWLTHRHILNDLYLPPSATSIAEVFNSAGYDTGYIGKWHLDGHGRLSYTPPERRQGFRFWRALECSHDYNHSIYYADEDYPLLWDGYDAIAQTCEAQKFLYNRRRGRPFALFLSWGPPHAPYQTAPEKYRRMFDPGRIELRPNVPGDLTESARKELAGYYAHIAVLDECLGEILGTLRELGLEENTIFVFTSDHGDMLRSQGEIKKQRPWDESIRVPFLLRYPARLGKSGKRLDTLFNTPDIMPTLLGLCGIEIPDTVEGSDFSGDLLAGKVPRREAALIMCPAPFGQWTREMGGREYRGLRTRRYTYCRDLDGPWLLYDNEEDPYQLRNRVKDPAFRTVLERLDTELDRLLKETNDEFMTAEYYIAQWNYQVNERGTVPYRRR